MLDLRLKYGEGVFGTGGGVWNGRGCLEWEGVFGKKSTVMNENSGVWENSCDRI